MPNVVYKPLRSTHRTSVDIGIRRDFHSPVAEAFLTIIRQQFSEKSRSLNSEIYARGTMTFDESCTGDGVPCMKSISDGCKNGLIAKTLWSQRLTSTFAFNLGRRHNLLRPAVLSETLYRRMDPAQIRLPDIALSETC